jgi:hypothetical protein
MWNLLCLYFFCSHINRQEKRKLLGKEVKVTKNGNNEEVGKKERKTVINKERTK